MRSVLLGMLVVVLAGCSDPLSPEKLVGDWDEAIGVPGSFRHMLLDTSVASEIFGGGNFCIEAGACGTFTVTGNVKSDAVQLHFAYSDGSSTDFQGRFTARGTLSGTETCRTPLLCFRNGVTFQRTIWPIATPG